MTESKQKFEVYTTVLRFIAFNVTSNLRKVFLDVDLADGEALLTALFAREPAELDLELFDDISANSKAHLPHMAVRKTYRVVGPGVNTTHENAEHDFIVFAFCENVYDY
jgi:hypothetical protein